MKTTNHLVVTIIAGSLGLVHVACQGNRHPSAPLALPSASETLRYEAYLLDGKGGRELIHKAELQYSPASDIEIEAGKEPNLWSKRLRLFDSYELGTSFYRKKDLNGFALWIKERENPLCFSWNWFDRESSEIFIKVFGSGRIRVVTVETDGLVEVAAVELIEDIVLFYKDDLMAHEPGDFTHEFVLLKGSVFRVGGEG